MLNLVSTCFAPLPSQCMQLKDHFRPCDEFCINRCQCKRINSGCWACPDRVLYDAALNEEGTIARLNHNGRFLHSNYTTLNFHSCPKLDNLAQGGHQNVAGHIGDYSELASSLTSGLECALHDSGSQFWANGTQIRRPPCLNRPPSTHHHASTHLLSTDSMSCRAVGVALFIE